jgi:integrase/recombinase XerD
MQATARIFFQTAPAKRTSTNLCPVKLCITHKRERKYYSIVDKLKNNEWQFVSDELDKEGKSDIDKITSDSPRGKYRDITFEYKRIVEQAESIIKNLPVFSFNQFEEKFLNKVIAWDNVFAAIWSHIQDLRSEKRFGYASSFESTLRAIKEFHTGKSFNFNPRKDKVETREKEYLNGKPLNFVDITPSWLKRFENWMQESGKSKSTIGIYVRNIRVVFNLAIKEHKVKAEYPFDKHTPKSANGRKLALTAHQISLIANFETKHPQEQFYRDIFMFSFLGNGMNLSDIARLKYSHISDNEIYFIREKSKNENLKEVEIRVPVTLNIQNIINKHGNKVIGFDAYIFPVLKEDWTEERKYAEIKQLTKQVNKYVRRIALSVGINEKISSYTARHSWATISKNSGTSTEFIKEALGHSSVAVTENYLKSFEKSTRQEHAQRMEDTIFNNQKAV